MYVIFLLLKTDKIPNFEKGTQAGKQKLKSLILTSKVKCKTKHRNIFVHYVLVYVENCIHYHPQGCTPKIPTLINLTPPQTKALVIEN